MRDTPKFRQSLEYSCLAIRWLVAKGYVGQVELAMLMVGHTHEGEVGTV